MKLPIVYANVVVAYPLKPGGGCDPATHVRELAPVEVLTVHFAKRTMRVRYTIRDYFGKGEKIQTSNIDAQPFFDAYDLQAREEEAGDQSACI